MQPFMNSLPWWMPWAVLLTFLIVFAPLCWILMTYFGPRAKAEKSQKDREAQARLDAIRQKDYDQDPEPDEVRAQLAAKALGKSAEPAKEE